MFLNVIERAYPQSPLYSKRELPVKMFSESDLGQTMPKKDRERTSKREKKSEKQEFVVERIEQRWQAEDDLKVRSVPGQAC